MRHGPRYRKVWLTDVEVPSPSSLLCRTFLFRLHLRLALVHFTGNAIHLEMAFLIFCPSLLDNPMRLVTGQHLRGCLQTMGAAEMDITCKTVNVVMSKQRRDSSGYSLRKRRAGWLV